MTTVEMMDFVPEPASGRVFEASLTPEVADVTGTGRSRLDAIARWLQEIARGDLAGRRIRGGGGLDRAPDQDQRRAPSRATANAWR